MYHAIFRSCHSRRAARLAFVDGIFATHRETQNWKQPSAPGERSESRSPELRDLRRKMRQGESKRATRRDLFVSEYRTKRAHVGARVSSGRECSELPAATAYEV